MPADSPAPTSPSEAERLARGLLDQAENMARWIDVQARMDEAVRVQNFALAVEIRDKAKAEFGWSKDKPEDVTDDERTLAAALLSSQERAAAVANAGHADDCGGLDEAEGRCECGWLQREGAHKYIISLEDQLLASQERAGEAQARVADLELMLRSVMRGDIMLNTGEGEVFLKETQPDGSWKWPRLTVIADDGLPVFTDAVRAALGERT